jgi:hypothetical protein
MLINVDIDPTRDNVCGGPYAYLYIHPLMPTQRHAALGRSSIGSVIHSTTSRKHIPQDKTNSIRGPAPEANTDTAVARTDGTTDTSQPGKWAWLSTVTSLTMPDLIVSVDHSP